MKQRSRLWRILLSVDQFLNVLILNGNEDETISSHCYRHRDIPKWNKWMGRLDWLFFELTGEIEHCKNSYEDYTYLQEY